MSFLLVNCSVSYSFASHYRRALSVPFGQSPFNRIVSKDQRLSDLTKLSELAIALLDYERVFYLFPNPAPSATEWDASDVVPTPSSLPSLSTCHLIFVPEISSVLWTWHSQFSDWKRSTGWDLGNLILVSGKTLGRSFTLCKLHLTPTAKGQIII